MLMTFLFQLMDFLFMLMTFIMTIIQEYHHTAVTFDLTLSGFFCLTLLYCFCPEHANQ